MYASVNNGVLLTRGGWSNGDEMDGWRGWIIVTRVGSIYIYAGTDWGVFGWLTLDNSSVTFLSSIGLYPTGSCIVLYWGYFANDGSRCIILV